jgi:UDP-glucose:(heptosyl)LPS alpha-1,3-glucosyltransferase
MSGPEVAVVFPQLHRRGGIERVSWDLLEYLAPRHETVFVGSEAPEGLPDGVRMVQVGAQAASGSLGLLRQRAATGKVLASLGARTTVTMGSVVPPGDVLMVPSVHRAWLEAARTVQMGPVALPARIRFVMPRHRTLLAMEAQYFRGGTPRHIVCSSTLEAENLTRYYGIQPSLITVIPLHFDPERFGIDRRIRDRDAARRDLGIQEGEIAMMFIANELHRKGLGETLEAMARSGNSQMGLHVVGKADLGPYRASIHRLGLDDRVRYHGPSDDVGWELAAADLLVLPTQYEPFGLVIVEALASGVPVITSRLAGASAAIREGRTGLILEDPSDPDELAGLLSRAGDADLEGWGREAAESVVAYRRDTVMAQVEALIR